MKLYNAYYICKENINALDEITYETFKQSNSTVKSYYIQGWVELVDALAKIQNISYIKSNVKAVYETIPVFVRENSSLEVDQNTKDNFIDNVAKLKVSMLTIINLYESVDSEEKPIGIDVRIPKCEDLKQYIGILEEINFVFTQCPYLTNKDEYIEFRGTDIGSTWITFAIMGGTGTAILVALAKIIDSATIIKSHMVSLREQELQLKERQSNGEIKEELAREMVNLFKDMKHKYISEERAKLSKDLGETKDPEEDSKVELSIEKLSFLLDKGVQIYSSIDTPSEVKAVFPPLEKQESLITQVKELIEEKE